MQLGLCWAGDFPLQRPVALAEAATNRSRGAFLRLLFELYPLIPLSKRFKRENK